jgi:hypothetical protein
MAGSWPIARIWFILRRMRHLRFALLSVLATALLLVPSARADGNNAGSQPAAAPIAAAFQKYWAAGSPAEAVRDIDDIAKSGVTFDEALRLLRAGRTYTAQKTGVIMLQNHTEDDLEHYYAVNVPADYDPSRRYQVRFQLHGGIGGRQDNKPRGDGAIGALEGAEQIYVLPYAWDHAPWWGDDQIQNLNAIIDSLKRTYNVDENRVVLSGVSDGATGSYFIAMRDTTPFASFLPLNGYIMVLASDEIDDGRIFPNNLRNKPLFVVNGGKDSLYPISEVEPFTQHLMNSGVDITYDPQPDGEHNTKWWPIVKDPYEKFVTDHPRDPNPAKLSWQAADLTYNRDHWLILDKFGAAPGEAKSMPDPDVVTAFSLESDTATEGTLFNVPPEQGRVDLERKGNAVTATTKGVQAFTLLLSPDVFDFNQPIKVVANGKEVFNARVERNLQTLLKWAARDNDRTMLYGAELHINLTQ